MTERLTEEELDRLVTLTQDGVSGNTRLLLIALRQVRGDLEAKTQFAITGWLEAYDAMEEADVAREQVRKLRGLLQPVITHLSELEEAWIRGALSEHDGQGGTRSNRNTDVLHKIRAAHAASEQEEAPHA